MTLSRMPTGTMSMLTQVADIMRYSRPSGLHSCSRLHVCKLQRSMNQKDFLDGLLTGHSCRTQLGIEMVLDRYL